MVYVQIRTGRNYGTEYKSSKKKKVCDLFWIDTPGVPDWSPTVLEDLDTEEPECIVDLASIFELPLSDLPDIRVIQESTTVSTWLS
jgi:hypothetical protein